ncbi:MAG: transporter permease [Phycisphaerales bacterium]|nr:transporter permease [Phycisphaerales bacterium]
MRRFSQLLVLLLVAAVFAVFLAWPIWQVLVVGFRGFPGPEGQRGPFTLDYVLAVFQDRGLRAGLANSAIIAVCTTLVAMVISVPLAMLSVRFAFPGKGLVSGMLLVPLILPPFVGAIGMRQIIGPNGALTALVQHLGLVSPGTPVVWFGSARIVGIILVEALSLYPILFLNVSAALANLDPAMEQAAANLGATKWTIFRKITLPLMRPGLFAGGTIVLIWSFTELGTPLMFDYSRVTPVQIFQRITQVSGNPTPYALTVVMLVTSILLYVVGKLVLGRNLGAAVTKASTQAAPRPLGLGLGLLALLPFLLVIGAALLPHIGVILTSVSKVGAWYQSVLPRGFTPDHFGHALTHDLTLPSVANSVRYAVASTAIDIGLGLMIAWLIVRSPLPGWLRAVVDSVAMLPLAVPGLVLAFGFLAVSVQLQTWIGGSKPFLVKYNIDPERVRKLVDVAENPTLLLIVAYAMRRLPYVVRSAVAGLQQTPADLELAARNLGASGWLTLRRVTVPLIAANLLAGGLLAFAFAMLEVSDSILLAQKAEFWPITKAIYELFYKIGDGRYLASALGVWAMVLLTLTILSANSLLGKRMGAIFRV